MLFSAGLFFFFPKLAFLRDGKKYGLNKTSSLGNRKFGWCSKTSSFEVQTEKKSSHFFIAEQLSFWRRNCTCQVCKKRLSAFIMSNVTSLCLLKRIATLKISFQRVSAGGVWLERHRVWRIWRKTKAVFSWKRIRRQHPLHRCQPSSDSLGRVERR